MRALTTVDLSGDWGKIFLEKKNCWFEENTLCFSVYFIVFVYLIKKYTLF